MNSCDLEPDHQCRLFSVDEINVQDMPHDLNWYSLDKPLIIRSIFNFNNIHLYQDPKFKHLLKHCSDNTVQVRLNSSETDYQQGTKYKSKKMLFSTYLRHLIKNNKTSHNSYMAVQPMQLKMPQLCELHEIPIELNDINPNIKYNNIMKHRYGGPNLWIAHSNHYEFNHCDPDSSLLCVTYGFKKIKLFHPKFLNSLYCNPIGSKGRTIQSQILLNNHNTNTSNTNSNITRNSNCNKHNRDCDSVTITTPQTTEFKSECKNNARFDNCNCNCNLREKYPLFYDNNVYGYECTLNETDMLYIPQFWFHQVTSFGHKNKNTTGGNDSNDSNDNSTIGNVTISVNYFIGDDGKYNFIDRIFSNKYLYQSFKYWIINILEQSRFEFKDSFKVWICNLSQCLPYFIRCQFHSQIRQIHLNRLKYDILLHLMQTKTKQDFFYNLGNIVDESNLPQIKRNIVEIKIRGLSNR